FSRAVLHARRLPHDVPAVQRAYRHFGAGARMSDATRSFRLLARNLNDVTLVGPHFASGPDVRPHVDSVVTVLDNLGIEARSDQTIKRTLSRFHRAWFGTVQHDEPTAPHRWNNPQQHHCHQPEDGEK